jgi:hypothetical protein
LYNQLTKQLLTVTTGSRQLVDLSAYVTAGSTGVSLYFDNGNFGNGTVGCCHPSQTTIRTQAIKNHADTMAYCGINANREASIYVGAGVDVYLVGEFDSDAEFLTSDVDKTPVSNLTWTSTAHAETSTAKFAIYNIVKAGDADVGLTGCRHGDSTDDTQTTLTNTNAWAIVPLNSSFESDLYVASGYSFYLIGFIVGGAAAVEPASDKSTATTGSYQTITPTTGTPEYIIVQYRGTHTADANGNQARLREPSATDIWGDRPAGLHTTIVKADVSGNIEQIIAETGNDFFVVGNITNAASASIDTVDATFSYGDTINFTTTGFSTLTSWTLTDSAANTISLTSGGETSAVMPDYANGVSSLLDGAVTLEVSDGTLTDTIAATLTAKTGYTSVNLTSGFSTGAESYLNGYTGTPAIGDEFHALTAHTTLGADGSHITNNTTTVYAIDATDGYMESFQILVGSAVNTRSIVSSNVESLVKSLIED